jgi:hypothetical protein
MALITREQIIEKVKNKDTNFFYGLYNGELEGQYISRELEKEVKTVYDQHYGDGNEWTIAFEFTQFGMYVLLEGYYSSWDSPDWDSVSHAEPFQYTETRFKEATLEYIRDKKIEEVLKTEEK